MNFLMLLLVVVGAANAATTLITPTGITYAGTSGTLWSDSTRLIDSSGLSGAPTLANYSGLTHAAQSSLNAWVSSQEAGSTPNDFFVAGKTVVFDVSLGANYFVSDFVWWGYSIPGNAPSAFSIELSNDGGTTFGTAIHVSETTSWDLTAKTKSLGAGAQHANFVRLKVTDNFHGLLAATTGDRVGLTEFRFLGDVIPEPSVSIVLALSGLGLLARRRRA